jgi:hypothetical protein
LSLHIHRVETRPYKDFPMGEKWCFVCRKRVEFIQTMHVPIDPMSYYGPHWSVRCPKGHHDGDIFPGYVREWDE